MKEQSREKLIEQTSVLNMAVNIALAVLKILIGMITSSIAFVSEGVNNATDAASSLLTLIGTKLARKHPDEKHPFGYGRIEYLAGLIIGALILVSGVRMVISSVELLIHPEPMSVSVLPLVLIAVSAVVKFILGTRTIRVGKKTGSAALEGVGVECRNDSFVSILSIVSALVYLLFHVSVDAIAGIVISAIIIKAGVEVLLATIHEILGRPGDKDLAKEIYAEIRTTDGIVNAADMMLHNYGPGAWSGSVNVEIDHKKSVGEMYQILHALQLKIMHEKKVTMVFGIYAVDEDTPGSVELRKNIAAFVRGEEHVRSYHAVYREPGTNRIYCDLIVDYKLKDWDEVREHFLSYMKEKHPDSEVVLTIETEYV